MRHGRRLVIGLIVVGAIYGGIGFAMASAKRGARVRIVRIYDRLMQGSPAVGMPHVHPSVAERLQSQETDFGRVRSYAIEECITQVTTRPAFCSVQVQRDRGRFVERLYWYGEECLSIEIERSR